MIEHIKASVEEEVEADEKPLETETVPEKLTSKKKLESKKPLEKSVKSIEPDSAEINIVNVNKIDET